MGLDVYAVLASFVAPPLAGAYLLRKAGCGWGRVAFGSAMFFAVRRQGQEGDARGRRRSGARRRIAVDLGTTGPWVWRRNDPPASGLLAIGGCVNRRPACDGDGRSSAL